MNSSRASPAVAFLLRGLRLGGGGVREDVGEEHFPKDRLDGGIQGAPFGVVGGLDEIDAVVRKKRADFREGFVAVYGDGVAAAHLYKLHARHVREAVADVDHVAEGHAPLILGGVGV